MQDMFGQFEKTQKSMFKAFGIGAFIALAVNVGVVAGIIYGLYWGYNHVISPSFDTPQLQVR